MTFEEIQKEIRDRNTPVMDFEDFYNEMTKNDPLFFKDYFLTIDYYENIVVWSLKNYNHLTFSCKIEFRDKKEIKKYFEKFNFFLTGEYWNSYNRIISMESIKDILNNNVSDYKFSRIENNKLYFTNNEKNNGLHLSLEFSYKKFEKYLTDKEKEKLNMQIKMLELKKRKEIIEQRKQEYEKSKREFEEMESNLTDEEKLYLSLIGVI